MKNAIYYEMQAEQFSEKEWKEMGDRIKESCKAAGYKHTDLAGFLGIERQHMYRILKGMLPCKSEYIYEIAQILGVSTDYLFFGDKKSNTTFEITRLLDGRTPEQMETAKNILKAYFGEL